jgi:hypothetical protein
MTPAQQFHLTAFRQTCRHSGVEFTVGASAFTGVKSRRKPTGAPPQPNTGTDAPERITGALEDFVVEDLPTQGAMILAAGYAYRIVTVDPVEPLVHFDCAAGTPAP